MKLELRNMASNQKCTTWRQIKSPKHEDGNETKIKKHDMKSNRGKEVTCADFSLESLSNFIFAQRAMHSCIMRFKSSIKETHIWSSRFLGVSAPCFHQFNKFNKFKMFLRRVLEISMRALQQTLIQLMISNSDKVLKARLQRWAIQWTLSGNEAYLVWIGNVTPVFVP